MVKLAGAKSSDYFCIDSIKLPATGADLINTAIDTFALDGSCRDVSLYLVDVPCRVDTPRSDDEVRARQGPPIGALDLLDVSMMGARFLAVVSRSACLGGTMQLAFHINRKLLSHSHQCSPLVSPPDGMDLSPSPYAATASC